MVGYALLMPLCLEILWTYKWNKIEGSYSGGYKLVVGYIVVEYIVVEDIVVEDTVQVVVVVDVHILEVMVYVVEHILVQSHMLDIVEVTGTFW